VLTPRENEKGDTQLPSIMLPIPRHTRPYRSSEPFFVLRRISGDMIRTTELRLAGLLQPGCLRQVWAHKISFSFVVLRWGELWHPNHHDTYPLLPYLWHGAGMVMKRNENKERRLVLQSTYVAAVVWPIGYSCGCGGHGMRPWRPRSDLAIR